MNYLEAVLRILDIMGLVLYGMKIMSNCIQKVAGDRLQRVLNFIARTSMASVLTGFGVTSIIQSSSAAMVTYHPRPASHSEAESASR